MAQRLSETHHSNEILPTSFTILIFFISLGDTVAALILVGSTSLSILMMMLMLIMMNFYFQDQNLVHPHEKADFFEILVQVGQVLAFQDCFGAARTLIIITVR